MNESNITRREALTAGGVGLALAAFAGQRAHGVEPTTSPSFEFIFRMRAQLETMQMVGKNGKGTRMIFPAKGGTVEGPKISGTVLPGGGDWMTMRDDQVGELDVRGSMKTDDGVFIYTHYTGLSHNHGEDGARYFVISPRFETAAPQYQWLTQIVAVGIGSNPGPGEVQYDMYAIRP